MPGRNPDMRGQKRLLEIGEEVGLGWKAVDMVRHGSPFRAAGVSRT